MIAMPRDGSMILSDVRPCLRLLALASSLQVGGRIAVAES
jgi:hypothetical protein